MKFENRAAIIMKLLGEENAISVAALSEKLGVSLVTVRKDLQRMEAAGQLIRTFGGAAVHAWDNVQQQKLIATQRIAHRVVEEIQEGDCIILNAGNTTQLIARNLLRFAHLRVITNSIAIAKELCNHPGFQLILLGGQMTSNAVFTHGRDAIMQLEQYKADKLIQSANGISCSKGLTTRHMEATDLFRKMIERAREVIMVADDSKIGFESFYHVNDVQAVTKIVTNESNNVGAEEELRRLEKMGIEICRC